MEGPRFGFANSYARLPERFFARVQPTGVARPRLLLFNRPLADELRIALMGSMTTPSRRCSPATAPRRVPSRSAWPIPATSSARAAMGDGRAAMIGEIARRDGRRRDVHLKGSGPTRFARRGDGRATLSAMLREYIVSEAMAGLGIPTTRALAVVATGAPVYRDGPSPAPC